MLACWEIYVTLYNLIQGWAAAYVPETASRKVARYAIARVFQLACTAWETSEGPYAETGDIALSLMVREAWMEGSITLGAPEGQIPVPGDGFISDLAQCYATVYQLAQFAKWSLYERETISTAIRRHDPQHHDALYLRLHLAGQSDALCALRRAVDAADNHSCGDDVICDAATEIFIDEARRGALWVKYRTS